MTKERRQESFRIREEAAELARSRSHPTHQANGDEQRYADEHYPMSFTKGLKHNDENGLVESPDNFDDFRRAIDNGFIDPFTEKVEVPLKTHQDEKRKRRKWEAPTAGFVFDLEGPDAQAVTMPPAPSLGSEELIFEMAEVYELALIRDVHFKNFIGTDNSSLRDSCKRLSEYYYDKGGYREALGYERGYREALSRRRLDNNGRITPGTVFRGSSPSVEIGPYLSQFLLIGAKNPISPNIKSTDGLIAYGAQKIDQRVIKAEAGRDFMVDWDEWLAIQDGFKECQPQPPYISHNRGFITTPRDLATYVHFDALYQAYLNACIILLNMETPFDPAFGALSGNSKLNHFGKSIERNTTGFALFGGPHILTLVTEVATRALKAVRYQKFNNHLRLRPEVLAARIYKADEIAESYPRSGHLFQQMRRSIQGTVNAIGKKNGKDKDGKDVSLLPMAFPEGSPMHPSYGAGHAVVAGACVTILKAFFDTGTVLVEDENGNAVFKRRGNEDEPVAYIPDDNGEKLESHKPEFPLTLKGELNKLAANISIGRNMAGVHFYSDYYDSIRMGEEIAIGILEEQALTYPKDEFRLSVPTFDGSVIRIPK